MKLFLGWIPNLRGRLSFSTIGTSTEPYPFRKYIRDDYVAITQNRTLNDSAIPRKIRYVLFTAKYSPFKILFLCLFKIFSKFKQNGILINNRAIKLIAAPFTKENSSLEKKDSIAGSVFVIDNKYIKSSMQKIHFGNLPQAELKRELSLVSVLEASFRLPRNGMLELKLEHISDVEDDKLRWSSKEQGIAYKQFELDTVSQVYYFMKDLCHQHQHHHAKSDTLLPLIRAHGETGEIDGVDKQSLNDSVLRSLYRAVLKMRRTHSEGDHYKMKGILAYIQSFKNVMGSQKVDQYVCDADACMLSAIEAKAGQLKSTSEKKARFYALLPGIFSLSVATMGLMFAFSSVVIISLIKTESDVTDKLSKVIDSSYFETVIWFLDNINEVFAIILAVLLVFFLLLSDLFKESRLRFDAFRIIYGIKWQYSLGAFLIVTGLGIVYYAMLLWNIVMVEEVISFVSSGAGDIVLGIISALAGLATIPNS
jgi:hypothetical protein